jgi:hypothetical protein
MVIMGVAKITKIKETMVGKEITIEEWDITEEE